MSARCCPVRSAFSVGSRETQEASQRKQHSRATAVEITSGHELMQWKSRARHHHLDTPFHKRVSTLPLFSDVTRVFTQNHNSILIACRCRTKAKRTRHNFSHMLILLFSSMFDSLTDDSCSLSTSITSRKNSAEKQRESKRK